MLTQLKHFWSYKRRLWELCFFWKEKYIHLLFKNLTVLTLPDKVTPKNCILICKYFNQSLPKTIKNWFTLATASHAHTTRWSNSGCLKIPHKTKLIHVPFIHGTIYRISMPIFCFQLLLSKLTNLIKNTILLLIFSRYMSCIMHLCIFWLLHHKKLLLFQLDLVLWFIWSS